MVQLLDDGDFPPEVIEVVLAIGGELEDFDCLVPFAFGVEREFDLRLATFAQGAEQPL